jgi:ceramide glucosyltransferase
VVSNAILGALALLSLALTLWQWLAARRFPLHRRIASGSFAPAVSLLKPVKGCDDATEECLRSWFQQEFGGNVQILFGVASAEDPACGIVRRLCAEYPQRDAQLVVCGPLAGENAKVSKLLQLAKLTRHEIVIVSDADVRVPPDFLANMVAPLKDPEVGLVNCFYRVTNPTTLAMRWEAIAINADFWSQVLQSLSLKPMDFALGAVMATRRKQIDEIGGFAKLVNCLADDYQLGNRIARRGYRISVCPVVVECWSGAMGWAAVWKHQLRWARTIRVCQPLPYFFSVLSNATLWPLLWLALNSTPIVCASAAFYLLFRVVTAVDLERRLSRSWTHLAYAWLVPIKDLLQVVIWLLAFLGNRVEWRGVRMRLHRDGTLARI